MLSIMLQLKMQVSCLKQYIPSPWFLLFLLALCFDFKLIKTSEINSVINVALLLSLCTVYYFPTNLCVKPVVHLLPYREVLNTLSPAETRYAFSLKKEFLTTKVSSVKCCSVKPLYRVKYVYPCVFQGNSSFQSTAH